MKKILIIYVYSVFSFLYASSLDFYQNSYAVIIGINNYHSENVKDLGYAVEDAESIANLLIDKLGYKEENIHLLLDEEATQINIKNKFDLQNPIISYGLGTMSDFRGINDGGPDDVLGVIIYKTKDSNNGNWGIELIYNYFFNNYDEDIFILP